MTENRPARKAATTANQPAGEEALLAKVALMPDPYRTIGERLHALILRAAPGLQPTLWYGMPAYAKDGNVICFFRADRYFTFGLTDKANHALEDDATHQLRASAWFFTAMDGATEARLSAIVCKAAS